MNTYLKELGKMAGFEQLVSESITKAGVTITTNHPKSELITTHTARRSFATNLCLDKFPTETIRKITDHRTESAFMQYIKVTPREHAQKLREHWQTKKTDNVRPLRVANYD